MVESSSTLPRCQRSCTPNKEPLNRNHNIVISTSSNSLTSRRRRNKTVHFGGDNLQINHSGFFTTGRTNSRTPSLVSPPQQDPPPSRLVHRSAARSQRLEPNVQQLFSFIETVLSAWVIDDNAIASQSEFSESEDGRKRAGTRRKAKQKPMLDVLQILGKKFSGYENLGSKRFRHHHWRITIERCNARFLNKVAILINMFCCAVIYHA